MKVYNKFLFAQEEGEEDEEDMEEEQDVEGGEEEEEVEGEDGETITRPVLRHLLT